MKINNEIRSKVVRLIDGEGNRMGDIGIKEAMKMADEANLDLVEFTPNANPPICKLLDYSKFKYEQKKKEKENAKKQRENKINLKELQLRPTTDTNDLNTKIKHAKEFISKGDHVKFTMKFRGREISHIKNGEEMLNDILGSFTEIKVLQPVKRNGRNISLIICGK